jgi:hypothetical protein
MILNGADRIFGLTIRSSGGSCEHGNAPWASVKVGTFSPVKQLLVSQEGLPVELVVRAIAGMMMIIIIVIIIIIIQEL